MACISARSRELLLSAALFGGAVLTAAPMPTPTDSATAAALSPTSQALPTPQPHRPARPRGPRHLPPTPPGRPDLRPETQRLRQHIEDLRWRLQRSSEAEVDRHEGPWWDLPNRRRQQQRLLRLRLLRQQLEEAQRRLLDLQRPPSPDRGRPQPRPTPEPQPTDTEKSLKKG